MQNTCTSDGPMMIDALQKLVIAGLNRESCEEINSYTNSYSNPEEWLVLRRPGGSKHKFKLTTLGPSVVSRVLSGLERQGDIREGTGAVREE